MLVETNGVSNEGQTNPREETGSRATPMDASWSGETLEGHVSDLRQFWGPLRRCPPGLTNIVSGPPDNVCP